MKKALILVDLQNDFCPGGSLPVPEGDRIMTLANQLQKHFSLVVATKDWHPSDHTSFAVNHPNHKIGDVIDLNGISQILWPVHCVQNSTGAAFHPDLDTTKIFQIFYKGTDSKFDSYSAFFDNAKKRATGLHDYLQTHAVTSLYVAGLATDYCVLYTAMDAKSLGYDVNVIRDVCRGVELHAGAVAKAFETMQEAGIKILNSEHFTLPDAANQ